MEEGWGMHAGKWVDGVDGVESPALRTWRSSGRQAHAIGGQGLGRNRRVLFLLPCTRIVIYPDCMLPHADSGITKRYDQQSTPVPVP
jgi:hypothetical protein